MSRGGRTTSIRRGSEKRPSRKLCRLTRIPELWRGRTDLHRLFSPDIDSTEDSLSRMKQFRAKLASSEDV
jgi:hypothetical protein